jgi:hypothetical protein
LWLKLDITGGFLVTETRHTGGLLVAMKLDMAKDNVSGKM